MSDTTSLVTAAEISRLAGVTRATVSNWRRRHPEFPSPAGGSEARPVFVLDDVRDWLREHGVTSAETPLRELRTVLRARVNPQEIPGLLELLARSGGTLGPRAKGVDPEVTRAVRAAVDDVGIGPTVEALTERGLEENPTTGVYITPEPVARLMAQLAGERLTEVFDPACGSGALLVAAAERDAHTCYGQDVVAVQALRARLRLEYPESPGQHPTADVRTGDSLLVDAFPDLRVDTVLTNPPYLQRDWGSDELAMDPRWTYGVPPRGESELAWVQHALAHLRPGGLAVMLLPPAVAYRPSGRRIRAELLRRGALRAVIALPTGSAPPRHLSLHLWVMRAPDPAGADEVLFLDLTPDRSAWDVVARKVSETWHGFDRGERGAGTSEAVAVARVMDLLDDEVDLTPGRHVRATLDADHTADAVAAGLAGLTDDIDALRAAVSTLPGWSGVTEQSWRTATVADLTKGGAVQVLMYRPKRDESEPFDTAEVGRPVLIGRDLATGAEPSGSIDGDWSGSLVVIRAGDVVMPQIRDARRGHSVARVAGDSDAGAVLGPGVFLLRPDPARIDPWFLAGFAAGPDNATSTHGSTTIRTVAGRIRLPLLPLQRQREYGAAFEQLLGLRLAARRADRAAARLTELVSTGLGAGALEPRPATKTSPRKGRK
ncbi:N-6 DNA methylase [Nocardia aurea]|uniref:N-6 DNA methylase n=1 Tax=Nocardia aurea TaxID=2144174 RepID=UPI0033B76441